MFLSLRVNITNRLQDQNRLEIDFGSALLKAREIRAAHPEHKWEGFNADLSRLAVRKAQYKVGMGLGSCLDDCWALEARSVGDVSCTH